jgi:hypothetical protein
MLAHASVKPETVIPDGRGHLSNVSHAIAICCFPLLMLAIAGWVPDLAQGLLQWE